ncbi:hypothetical protein, partial [Trueperella pyogenes]
PDSSFEYLAHPPTVLLNIPATDSYTSLVEPIFMFYTGHPAHPSARQAGRGVGGPALSYLHLPAGPE